MQTTYFVLIVVALMSDGHYYISPKTPAFPYLELCQMTEERVKREYRPTTNVKGRVVTNLLTKCNEVRFMDEDTGD